MQNNGRSSIRLFRNPILESLTHVHPVVPLVVWLPVIAVLIWRSLSVHHLPLGPLMFIGVAGLLFWTLTEYSLHRFVFHFPAKTRIPKRLVFLFHGVHHDTPQDKTRLVMPPAGAILIMAMLWLIFSAVIPAPWTEPFVAFFLVGYLCYDYIHYSTHHFRLGFAAFRYLKRHHMLHHYSKEKARYGVSSPLWDMVFGTTGTRPMQRQRR